MMPAKTGWFFRDLKQGESPFETTVLLGPF